MKRQYGTGVRVIITAGLLLSCFCANPVDEPPLEWRSRAVAPLTNDRFMIAEDIDDMFEFDSLEVIQEDTLSFAVTRVDSADYERTEGEFDSMFYKVKLGALNLQKMPDAGKEVPYDNSGIVALPMKVPLQGVRNIKFYDEPGNNLQVTFNNKTETAFNEVIMSFDGVADTVQNIGAQTDAVFSLPLGGKTVSDTMDIDLQLQSSSRAVGFVGIAFSLNGMRVFRMEVLDSLIAFSHEYDNIFVLTDTMDLDFVDIDRGSFVYTILNHCGVSFNLECIHDHIWSTGFCTEENIEDVSQLTGISSEDSADYFKGGIPGLKIPAGPNTAAQLQEVILAGKRLFPEWNDSLGSSSTKVRYTVEILATGEYVTLSALDSMMFTIATHEFRFEAMAGTFVEPISYTVDTQKVSIELPWQNTVKDSLRDRFILSNVEAMLALRTKMGESSQVDSLEMDIYAFDPEEPLIIDTLHTSFIALSNDSVYNRTMNITRVANLFSDSIAMAVNMRMPAGTYVRFITDTRTPLPPGTIGRMVVNAVTDFQLKARCEWKVDDVVNMDLGGSRVPLPEAMQFFSRQTERDVVFEVWVRNNSNLYTTLFALAAPDALMDTLDSLTMNEVYAYLTDSDSALANGYIPLFGSEGILIPQRDTVAYEYSRTDLKEPQIDLLLSTDSLNLRWWVQFKGSEDPDVLKLTDYIDIKSRLDIRGENNMDSLLIW